MQYYMTFFPKAMKLIFFFIKYKKSSILDQSRILNISLVWIYMYTQSDSAEVFFSFETLSWVEPE